MSVVLPSAFALFFLLLLFSSSSSSVARQRWAESFHLRMTRQELLHYFEVPEPHLVHPANYQLVSVVREAAISKRDGGNDGADADAGAVTDASADHHRVSLSVFGKSYSFGLRRNAALLHEEAEVVIVEEGGDERPLPDVGRGSCHYLVSDGGGLAGSLSNCVGGKGGHGDDYKGFLKDGNELLEVMPLRDRLKQMLRDDGDSSEGVHLVKVSSHRRLPEESTQTITKERVRQLRGLEGTIRIKGQEKVEILELEGQDEQQQTDQNGDEGGEEIKDYLSLPRRENNRTRELLRPSMKKKRFYSSSSLPPLTMELAVFFDCAATNSYLRFYDDDAAEVVDFMLSLVNAMQGIYNYPSLGREVALVVTYAELQKRCKVDVAGGEREGMLKSFCDFQRLEKERKEKRWDVALLMSGTDMYGVAGDGGRSYATMGLSTVTGTCEAEYECVIGEVGVTDDRGDPYPSTGFLSALVMVHEIGHNLGMHHDSTQNHCSQDGGIMSPTRGTAGECIWSTCSRDFVQHIDEDQLPCLFDAPLKVAADHNKFGEAVGMQVGADQQCKVLMKDKNARVDEEASGGKDKICNGMICKSSRRYGTQPAGPALPGTDCGGGRRCYEGECVRRTFDAPPRPPKPPAFSDWRKGSCRHSCIDGASPVVYSHRVCSDFSGCDGPADKVELCDNPENDCPSEKRTPRDFATLMCIKFKRISPMLDGQLDGEGKMVTFNKRYPKRVCSIHCLAKGSRNYFAPVLEFENVDLEGYSPYFPDGTVCHSKGGREYHCLDGVCQSPSSRGGRAGAGADTDGGYGVVQSASTGQGGEEGQLEEFFFTNEDGSPAAEPPRASEGAGNEFDVDEEVRKWKN